ncbi:MAG: M48 family metalloprotease [Thiotrichales bacterium]|nr:M48 family metalloprotease [Thiotrichales bacterium]
MIPVNRVRWRLCALLSSVLIGLASSQALYAQTLPDLGAPDLIEYDQRTEQRLGNAFTQSLISDVNLNQDPETLNYIRQLGQRIASHSGQNRPFSFYVIQDSSINAFAGPNGVIGIHTGLISEVKNEAELASVLAHEIAHVTQQHLSRRYEYNSTQGNLQSFATLLAAILVGMYNPNAGMATLMGGMGMNLQDQLRNSREHETEADNVGIKILHESGYDPHAMADFFGRLAKASQFQAQQVPEILRTHPVTDSRLAAAANRAQVMPPLKAPKQSNDLTLIKLRLAALNNQLEKLPKRSLKTAEQCYFENLKQRFTPSSETFKSDSKNLACLIDQTEQNLDQPLYSSLLVERLKQMKKIHHRSETWEHGIGVAKKVMDYQQAIFPNNLAVVMRHAELWQLLGENEKARQILQNAKENTSNQYQINNQLAELAATEKQTAYAYFYQAKAQLAIGNSRRAKHYFEQAQQANQGADTGLEREINYFLLNSMQNFDEKNNKEE